MVVGLKAPYAVAARGGRPPEIDIRQAQPVARRAERGTCLQQSQKVAGFIDTIAAITILVPILLPIVLKLGIDPIHFGLIMTLNLMIGLLHPPLGMVLFVLARVAKLSVERTTIAILPWLVPLLLALVAITYIPELTLWLPKYMGLSK